MINIKRKTKVLAICLILIILSNVFTINVDAIEFNPSTGSDDEIHKEYTAELLDLQINTVMPLNEIGFDDYSEFDNTYSNDLTLNGLVKVNKNLENTISYLDELPEVLLVDENDNPVAKTDIFCNSEITLTPSDLYYISLYDLSIENGKNYKLLIKINDNNATISKYITYSDEVFISQGIDATMSLESINNIANVSFNITPKKQISGDMDNNGVITANDASIILDKYKNGNATEKDIEVGDMDGNGTLTANDASILLDIFKNNNIEL